jgi:hypothetical protein
VEGDGRLRNPQMFEWHRVSMYQVPCTSDNFGLGLQQEMPTPPISGHDEPAFIINFAGPYGTILEVNEGSESLSS